jgi:hypothetical protein
MLEADFQGKTAFEDNIVGRRASLEQDLSLSRLNSQINEIKANHEWAPEIHEFVDITKIQRVLDDRRVIRDFERHDTRVVAYELDQTFNVHVRKEAAKYDMSLQRRTLN